MSGCTLSRVSGARWRAPRMLGCARRSLGNPSQQQDLDNIHRLRTHERITAANLDGEIDEFLARLERFYKPKAVIAKSVSDALQQNKYISSERRRHAASTGTVARGAMDHLKDFKKHLKDLAEAPHPDWYPGHSDRYLRQLDESKTPLKKYEVEMTTKEADLNRSIDKLTEQYEALVKVRDAYRKDGRSAALRIADDIVNSHTEDYAPISASFDPVDIDDIIEQETSIEKKSIPSVEYVKSR